MLLMRKVALRSLLAIVLVVTVAACGSSDDTTSPPDTSPPPAPVYGGNLIVGTSSEVDGFNPLSSQWSGPAYQIGRSVFDPLVVMDRDGRWQPYLAKSITPNADFTVWTFELRPDITFHNGETLDADALKMFFDAATTSPLSSQGFPEQPVVTKTGDMTVTLTFTEPWSEMPTALVEQPGYVIAPEQIQSGSTDNPIGTGPFVYESWVPDNHFKATKNPNYWRTGEPYLDSIEFRPIPDPALRINALQAGDVDAIETGSIGQSKLDEMAAAGLHGHRRRRQRRCREPVDEQRQPDGEGQAGARGDRRRDRQGRVPQRRARPVVRDGRSALSRRQQVARRHRLPGIRPRAGASSWSRSTRPRTARSTSRS